MRNEPQESDDNRESERFKRAFYQDFGTSHSLPKLEDLRSFRGSAADIEEFFDFYERRTLRIANDRLSYALSHILSYLAESKDPECFPLALLKLDNNSLNKLIDLLVPEAEKREDLKLRIRSPNDAVFYDAHLELFGHIEPLLGRDRELDWRSLQERHQLLKGVLNVFTEDQAAKAIKQIADAFLNNLEWHLTQELSLLEKLKKLFEESLLLKDRSAQEGQEVGIAPTTRTSSGPRLFLKGKKEEDEQDSKWDKEANDRLVMERIIAILEAQAMDVRIELSSAEEWPRDGIQGIPLLTYGELLGKLLEIERQLLKANDTARMYQLSAT